MEINIFDLDLKDKVIFIVEDNHTCYRYFEEIIKRTGATIIRAETGIEAIEIACHQNVPIDLALIDIQIPFINGVDVIREIRKSRNGIPILAETAFNTSDIRRNCFIAGCHEYLVKPIPPQQLLGMLKHYLYPEPKGAEVRI